MAEREVHLRDYLAIIRKHDFIVIVSFLLIFGTALTVSLYMPRIYQATAIIEVKSSSRTSGLPSLMQSVMSGGSDQASMETIRRLFTSRPILVETVGNLKRSVPEMIGILGSPDSLIPRIRTDIVPDTRMLEIKVNMKRNEGGSETAVRIANELIAVMQEHRSAKANAETRRRQAFIDEKMKEAESEIRYSDQKMRQFLKDGGDPMIWSAQSRHVMSQLASLMELSAESKTLIVAEQKKLNELDSRLASEPEWVESSRTFRRDVLWDKYRTDLADLRKELAAERIVSGEKNPKVEFIEAQIKEIEEDIKGIALEATSPSGKTESRNPTYQTMVNQRIEAELNLIAYKAQLEVVEDMLNKTNSDIERMFSEMPEKQFQFDKMTREVDYKIEGYKSLLEKKLEAEILANESGDNQFDTARGGIEIVDTAQPGGSPISPRTKFIAVIAGLVGLVVGLAMAFLAEYFENTYQSPEEAREALDIPVLGIIPFIRDRQAERTALPVLESPSSAEAESFRTLVTNIEFSSAEEQYKALMVTSSDAGEGKSFVAANLALAMAKAQSGLESAAAKQIILVDCDMRKAVQHDIFGVDNQLGLSNLLVENVDLESAIKDTEIPNLKVITCGPTPPNPVELLKSQRMSEILDRLRQTYAMLICDSPPVLPVADALVLASKLDGVLFLADLNNTPRELIEQARDQVAKLDVPLLGLICNGVDTIKHSSYYH